jgi:hypothetical protein
MRDYDRDRASSILPSQTTGSDLSLDGLARTGIAAARRSILAGGIQPRSALARHTLFNLADALAQHFADLGATMHAVAHVVACGPAHGCDYDQDASFLAEFNLEVAGDLADSDLVDAALRLAFGQPVDGSTPAPPLEESIITLARDRIEAARYLIMEGAIEPGSHRAWSVVFNAAEAAFAILASKSATMRALALSVAPTLASDLDEDATRRARFNLEVEEDLDEFRVVSASLLLARRVVFAGSTPAESARQVLTSCKKPRRRGGRHRLPAKDLTDGCHNHQIPDSTAPSCMARLTRRSG